VRVPAAGPEGADWCRPSHGRPALESARGRYDRGRVPDWYRTDSVRIFADGKMDAEGAQMTYLKRSRVRLLEVTVTPEKPTLWRWHISERDLEIMRGYETSRETAQIKGDNELFKLLSESTEYDPPQTP
jgi:hypothetical protein